MGSNINTKKKLIRVGTVGLTALALVSCSSLPLVKKEGAINYPGITITNSAKPLPINQYNKEELTEDDSVLFLTDMDYHAPYDVFEFDAQKGKYELEILTLLGTHGFKKSLMVPVVILKEKSGEKIELDKVLFDYKKATMRLPVHTYTKWTFSVEENCKLFLIVHSDMSLGDEVLMDISPIIKVRNNAFGRYRLKLQPKEHGDFDYLLQ
ncbi:MAG: hypothetical protein GXY77_12375 [Fibrobacter sp.]|nr:hypothetical protein [Fibrobacter sp.]